MSANEKDRAQDSSGNNSAEIRITSSGHIHIIRVDDDSRDAVLKKIAHHAAAAMLGISAEDLPELEDPPEEPMTAAQVEEKCRNVGAKMATPLSEDAIRRFIEKEINERRQKGSLLE